MAGKHVIALSGGVGGAKLALGLSKILPPDDLTIVANTGDDFVHMGLPICPDLDTVMYTLSDLANPETGWGVRGETWSFMDATKNLGGETWFNLGDRDLATHVARREMLEAGKTLSEVTAHLCHQLGIKHPVHPMTDDPVATIVHTPEGELAFQHYFVRDKCEPRVTGFHFNGMDAAKPSPGFAAALSRDDVAAMVICPSNPFVSVDPILKLPGVADALRKLDAPIIAVSPIVGGKAIKGPAAKMMQELRMPISAAEVARHYSGCIDGFVLDEVDNALKTEAAQAGAPVRVCKTIMNSLDDRIALAKAVVEFARDLSA